MSRICEVTNKKPFMKGRTYTTRGIAKKKKGIGLNITGKTKRRFLLNISKKRFWFDEENRFITLKVSTAGMKTITTKGLSVVVRQMRKEGKKV